MSTVQAQRAFLFKVTGSDANAEPREGDPDTILVQFNPVTLAYTAQNTMQSEGSGQSARQFVAESTAKLEFDLLFDTTHNGDDVRNQTNRVRNLLKPMRSEGGSDSEGGGHGAPPVVGFRWGTFRFKGMLQGFSETLDFFSIDGVPLRSSVHVSLNAQSAADVFTDEQFGRSDAAQRNSNVTLLPSDAAAGSRAGRGIGAANGFESLRNPGAAFAAVGGAGVQLKAASGFSAGIGVGAGGSAAFSALGASKGAEVRRIDVERLQPSAAPVDLSGDFGLGGETLTRASPGLTTDVGRKSRILFDR